MGSEMCIRDSHNDDAFLIIAGEKISVKFAIDSIINRIELAKNGPPAETRAATQNGDTIFLRPRPGASRMYPETDIPTVKVTDDELIKVRTLGLRVEISAYYFGVKVIRSSLIKLSCLQVHNTVKAIEFCLLFVKKTSF